MTIQALLELAVDDAETALVRLCVRLKNDGPLLATANGWSASDKTRHRELCAQLVAHLRRESQSPPVLRDEHAAALAAALDFELVARDPTHGAPPRLVRINGTQYALHRRRPPRASRFSTGGVHLQRWLRAHRVVPQASYGIELPRVPFVGGSLDEIAERGSVKVAVASFDDGVGFDPSPEYEPWRARGLDSDDGRWPGVEAALRAAMAAKADAVVFPELTISVGIRDRILRWLEEHDGHPFRLLVPGSFHVDTAEGVRAEAQLWDRDGRTLLCHHKLRPYLAKEPDGAREFVEQIVVGRQLRWLDAPIGTLCVGICLDFAEEDATFAPVWDHVAPDWVVVPAMDGSRDLGAYARRGSELDRAHGTTSIIANQPPTDDAGRRKSVPT
jgi:hypothetical protein